MTSEEKRERALRLKDGWRCVDCDAVTSAVNDVGEPQCSPCQRTLRALTARATANCACGEPMLADAAACGFCVAEQRVGAER